MDGDNGRYEVMILKGSAYGGLKGHPTGQSIANWKCSCKWGQWAFKRQMTFVGRLCSHGYASYLTMQGNYAKEPGHPFRKRNGSVEDFKKWVKDENGDHVDMDAADSYLSTLEDPATKEDAQAVLDYALTHHSERPERDYDQDGYSNDPDDAYKTGADALRHQPGKLSPHLYVVPEGEEQHFEDLRTVDGRMLYTPLSQDESPESIFAAKVAKLLKWYPVSITEIYREILNLDAEFGALAQALGKLKG